MATRTTVASSSSQPTSKLGQSSSNVPTRATHQLTADEISLGPILPPHMYAAHGYHHKEFVSVANGVNDEFVELLQQHGCSADDLHCGRLHRLGRCFVGQHSTIRYPVQHYDSRTRTLLGCWSRYASAIMRPEDLGYASDVPDNTGIALFNTATPELLDHNQAGRRRFSHRTQCSLLRRDRPNTDRGSAMLSTLCVAPLDRHSRGTTTTAPIFNSSQTTRPSARSGSARPREPISPIQRNSRCLRFYLTATVAGSLRRTGKRTDADDRANNST